MKATIDGISLEGTPEEINEFKKLRDAINEKELWNKLNGQVEGIKFHKPLDLSNSDVIGV